MVNRRCVHSLNVPSVPRIDEYIQVSAGLGGDPAVSYKVTQVIYRVLSRGCRILVIVQETKTSNYEDLQWG